MYTENQFMVYLEVFMIFRREWNNIYERDNKKPEIERFN